MRALIIIFLVTAFCIVGKSQNHLSELNSLLDSKECNLLRDSLMRISDNVIEEIRQNSLDRATQKTYNEQLKVYERLVQRLIDCSFLYDKNSERIISITDFGQYNILREFENSNSLINMDINFSKNPESYKNLVICILKNSCKSVYPDYFIPETESGYTPNFLRAYLKSNYSKLDRIFLNSLDTLSITKTNIETVNQIIKHIVPLSRLKESAWQKVIIKHETNLELVSKENYYLSWLHRAQMQEKLDTKLSEYYFKRTGLKEMVKNFLRINIISPNTVLTYEQSTIISHALSQSNEK